MTGTVSTRNDDPPGANAFIAGLGTFAMTHGFDLQFGDDVTLGDFRRYGLGPDRLTLEMRAGDGSVRFDLFGVQSVAFGGANFDRLGFASFLDQNGIAAIPLPASIWLMLGGIGALAATRRRRRAA